MENNFVDTQVNLLLLGATFKELRGSILVFLNTDGVEVYISAVQSWYDCDLIIESGENKVYLETVGLTKSVC